MGDVYISFIGEVGYYLEVKPRDLVSHHVTYRSYRSNIYYFKTS